MVRFLAILMLVAVGLPGVGPAFFGEGSRCGAVECRPAVDQATCCGGDVGGDAYCPMSGGPCACAVAPASQPEPKPDAPLPRPDRDVVTGLPNGPPQVTPVLEPSSAAPSVTALVLGLTAGRSHHEIQALLGVWRT